MFNLVQFFSKLNASPVLNPIREWLDSVEIQNPKVAQIICQLIPASCPFARTVKCSDRFVLPVLRGRVLFTIPPLCKLNPFYDQFVGLRFRSLMCLESAASPLNSR
ncbi:Mo-dependent nitrogenase C-terminal domain-containing protein [Leptolyngbya ohadii]|uniref:Mo-dependent nitrogenase C-terminal domain-containing protein n=1 Tax=Leptolyngbya ohadii TaxID=1962290 RepID=UPI000B59CCDC|nr:Mo-dependent nitrogenase C-terminal domain-containing protein [Leptolyngbya ohadii]